MLLKDLKYQTHLRWPGLSHLPCDLLIAIDYFDNLPMSWISTSISGTHAEDELFFTCIFDDEVNHWWAIHET
jgi:hypothetical protein